MINEKSNLPGAIITAAGLSSRMGCFKPLLKIGDTPAVERVINTFLAAGVKTIVLVTGNKAKELENSLNQFDLVFLKNENYENQDMFSSIKIGLEFLKNKCNKVFITPVDIPLFNSETVELLLKSEAPFSVPVFNNKSGHPVILNKDSIHKVLNYNGNGGLKGAIKTFSIKTHHIQVNDQGILFDMDTKEDYEKILELNKTINL